MDCVPDVEPMMPFSETTARAVLARWGSLAFRVSVNPQLLLAIVSQESGGDPNASRDEPQIGDESRGLTQVLKGTLEQMQADRRVNRSIRYDDLWDPEVNLRVADAVLVRQQAIYRGDLPKAISSYNQGTNLPPDSPRLNPPANPAYVNSVSAYYRWFLSHWPPDLGAPAGEPETPPAGGTPDGTPPPEPAEASTGSGVGIALLVIALAAAASRLFR